MPRNNASLAHARHGVDTQAAEPANDATHPHAARLVEPLRVYALTDAQRVHYTRIAFALPIRSVPRALPAHATQRLDRAGVVQATAWYDQSELARISLDGRPVTPAEIDDFGFRITFAREALVTRTDSTSLRGTHFAELTDAALAFEIARCNTTLCDALIARINTGTLTPAIVRDQRKHIRAARRARTGSALRTAGMALLAICREDSTLAWLNALPKGEGAAVERIAELVPEYDRRLRHDASNTSPDAVPAGLRERAFALAMEPLARITNAGRYLIKGRPERDGDYPGFRPRTSRKRARVPSPAPLPAPVPTPT